VRRTATCLLLALFLTPGGDCRIHGTRLNIELAVRRGEGLVLLLLRFDCLEVYKFFVRQQGKRHLVWRAFLSPDISESSAISASRCFRNASSVA